MSLSDACKKISIANYVLRHEVLKASILAGTYDTVLFLLCANDFVHKPSPVKMKAIIKAFITPCQSSSFRQEPNSYTINLTAECANKAIKMANAIKIWTPVSGEEMFNFIIDSDGGLMHDSVLDGAIKKTNTRRNGKINITDDHKRVKEKLSQMRNTLKPYWGTDLKHVGLPDDDKFYKTLK